MFKCGLCGKQSKRGEGMASVVLETRNVSYVQTDEFDEPVGVSHGWEIVREVGAHAACAEARGWR